MNLLHHIVGRSVTHLHPTICNPMDCSMPGFPGLYYLPEFDQTLVHWIRDAIQSFHSLSPPSPPALSLSQNQDLFQWISSSYQSPKYWSFSFTIGPSSEYSGLISFRIDWFDLLAAQESSPAPQFESINSLAFSLLYGPTLTSIYDYWKNHSFD